MPILTTARPLIAARPLSVLRLLNRLADADARYRQKAALREMGAERLADMGMTEADVEAAFR